MSVAVTDRIRRGTSGVSPFAVAWEDDLKLSHVVVADIAARDALPTWRRSSFMSVRVVSEDKYYKLGADTTLGGQVWTQQTFGVPEDIVTEDEIFDSNGYIKPELIQNIFLNSQYVVDSEVAMLALTTVTGNFVIRTDTGEVYVKLNNDDPSDITDFAVFNTPANVISVNGQTGAVSITVANLLSVPSNLTAFNNAVNASPSVSSLNSAIITVNNDLDTLEANKADTSYVNTHILGYEMVDPDDRAFVYWNDTTGELQYLKLGTGFSIVDDTVNIIAGGSGGDGVWGAITGTLSDQTDLQNALDGKEDVIVAGTNLQYWRGDKTWQTLDTLAVPENTNLYFTGSRVLSTTLTGLNVTGSTITAADTVLQAFGKAQNQINALLGGVNYQGTWNATTNSPALTSGVGTKGYYYVVSVAGSTSLDGINSWALGDWVIFNGTTWQKVDNTDAVISVNGQTGIVVITTTNGSGTTANGMAVDLGGALTANASITGAFNIGFSNTAVGIGVVPGSITASTRLDVRGPGTTTGFIQRWANVSDVTRVTFSDEGNFIFSPGAGNRMTINFNGTDDSIQHIVGSNVNGFAHVLNGTTSSNFLRGYANTTTRWELWATQSSNYSGFFNMVNGVNGLGLRNAAGDTTVLRILDILTSSVSNSLNPASTTERAIINSSITFSNTTHTASQNFILYTGVWNAALAGSFELRGVRIAPTINLGAATTSGLTLLGFDFSPIVSALDDAILIALRATAGQVIFGHNVTVTDNRLGVRGMTNAGSGLTLLLEDSAGVDTFGFQDNGKMYIYTTPANDDALTQVLVRDPSTGEIKYRNAATL